MPYRILAVLSLWVTLAVAVDTAPRWPLDLDSRYLTANFMEHRSGRFHAGLDLKTESRSGLPVRAAVDGWISRIRFRPGGYGKAVYLRGEDGRTYVYAHLERLNDPLRRLVRTAQTRRGRWDVSLQFPAGRHAVRAGDVLALSGQSGTAGPHLHFEVRDRRNRPMDPQAWGFAVADTIAPTLLRVRALPAGPAARIGGEDVARMVDAGGDPLPARLPPLDIQGPVAFTCAVVEVSDVRGHRLEPWRLALTVDDSLVYESRNEALSFDRNSRALLEWLPTPAGRERWLHRRDGNDLDGRRGGRWWADPDVLGPGSHEFVLTAEDRAGNTARTAWTVRVGEAGAGDPQWNAAPLRAEPSEPADGVAWISPLLVGLTDGSVEPVAGFAAREGLPVAAVALETGLEAAELRRLERAQGLAFLDWAVEITAGDWPTTAPLVLRPDWPDTLPPEAGLYYRNSRGWKRVGVPGGRPGAWRAELGGPGVYALLEDRAAPYLGPGPDEGIVRPGAASPDPAVSAPRWGVVPIRLEDLGSGVDPASIGALWNGRPLIVEPDLPRDRVLVECPEDAEPGNHDLELWAADRAGRAVERSYRLVLIPE